MTQVRLKRYATKYLFPHLSGWTLIKHALARRHDEAILLLILFQSSGFDKDDFYTDAVVFPLYLGYDHLVLNIGQPLSRPGFRGWRLLEGDEEDERETTADMVPAIENEGWPFLKSRATLDRIIETLPTHHADGKPARFNLEALAGAELLRGHPGNALAHVRMLLDFVRQNLSPYSIERDLEYLRQWESFGALISTDPAAAQNVLQQRIVTAAKHFAAPPVTPPED